MEKRTYKYKHKKTYKVKTYMDRTHRIRGKVQQLDEGTMRLRRTEQVVDWLVDGEKRKGQNNTYYRTITIMFHLL